MPTQIMTPEQLGWTVVSETVEQVTYRDTNGLLHPMPRGIDTVTVFDDHDMEPVEEALSCER